MTLVKLNNRNGDAHFTSLVDDLLKGFPSMFNDEFSVMPKAGSVPVNIRETNDAFVIDLVAPGMNKSDFKIKLEEKLLSISAEIKKEEKIENEKQVRREFRQSSFKKSFTVDENIDASNIQATYENGILRLNLPKKPEVKSETKEITIS